MSKPRYFSKDGKLTSSSRELSTSELAKILLEKEKHLQGERCGACKGFKKPGFKLCYSCQKTREMLIREHQLASGTYQEPRKPRKNRRKCVIINALLRKYPAK